MNFEKRISEIVLQVRHLLKHKFQRRVTAKLTSQNISLLSKYRHNKKQNIETQHFQ